MKKILSILFVIILLVSTVFAISNFARVDVQNSNSQVTMDFSDEAYPPLVNVRLF